MNDKRMKMLDLYCGDGLAAWGYWQSGYFSDIVGVDIAAVHGKRYAFDFINANAINLDYEFLMEFDFIHASPPCQAYSKITPNRHKHARLVAATHAMLFASGVKYVIENVEGSGRELKPNLVMNGNYFDLPMDRRRYFHVSAMGESVRLLSIADDRLNIHGGSYVRRDDVVRAMGLQDSVPSSYLAKMTRRGMMQGIPPVFTQWIAHKLFGKDTSE